MGFVVNLNKPAKITSHQAVQSVKHLLKGRKAGHAGTLDPDAEGVLLVCINEGTKVSRFLSDLDKEYVGVIKLGEKTDTFDAEGKILETKDASVIRRKDMGKMLKRFIGNIEQVPPMYSAVKHKGTPLYKFARKGRIVEVPPRIVSIFDIRMINFENPFLTLRIHCSKGTYIRSLANDIGDILGTGAHLLKLVRTRVGNFTIKESVALVYEEVKKGLIPLDSALSNLKEIVLKIDAAKKSRNGESVIFSEKNIANFGHLSSIEKSSFFRLKDFHGTLFAIGKIVDDAVKVERMLLIKPKEIF